MIYKMNFYGKIYIPINTQIVDNDLYYFELNHSSLYWIKLEDEMYRILMWLIDKGKIEKGVIGSRDEIKGLEKKLRKLTVKKLLENVFFKQELKDHVEFYNKEGKLCYKGQWKEVKMGVASSAKKI